MIVEADKLGCLREVLVIAAALSILDVREYPWRIATGDGSHARFVDPRSDFNALLNLWQYLADQAEELSGNAFPPDVSPGVPALPADPGMAGSARAAAADRPRVGMRVENRPAASDSADGRPTRKPAAGSSATQGGRGSLATDIDTERVHTALLSGLLSHIGLKQETGGNTRAPVVLSFVIWPGSALARSGPGWWWWPSWWRPAGCGAGCARPSNRNGWSASGETCCAAATPSRGGTRGGPAWWPPRR